LRKSFAYKSSAPRASNASWLISHSDALLAFTAFPRFLTDLRCCEFLSEGAKTVVKFGTVVKNQFNVKTWKLSKTSK